MGTSTYYNLGFEDSDRNELDGKKDYKLHLPADVPAKGFWSIIIYSMESFSMIPNKQNRYAISSLDKKIQYNDDKSIDIYFGETAPQGKESNWIPTAGQDFWLGIRFYGPDFSRLGLGKTRPLYRVALEWGRGPAPDLNLTHYDENGAVEEHLALCDPHGAWIDWRASS
jgi:hypothetical protein